METFLTLKPTLSPGTASGGALGGLDVVEGLEERGALVPRHLVGAVHHVVTVEAGDRDERDVLGVVADLLQVARHLTLDLVVTVLGPVDVVHLVADHDHLLDTEGEGEQGVLTGLTVLGDTGLELTLTGGDDENR